MDSWDQKKPLWPKNTNVYSLARNRHGFFCIWWTKSLNDRFRRSFPVFFAIVIVVFIVVYIIVVVFVLHLISFSFPSFSFYFNMPRRMIANGPNPHLKPTRWKYLLKCLSVSLSVALSVSLSVSLSLCRFLCQCFWLSLWLAIGLPFNLFCILSLFDRLIRIRRDKGWLWRHAGANTGTTNATEVGELKWN